MFQRLSNHFPSAAGFLLDFRIKLPISSLFFFARKWRTELRRRKKGIRRVNPSIAIVINFGDFRARTKFLDSTRKPSVSATTSFGESGESPSPRALTFLFASFNARLSRPFFKSSTRTLLIRCGPRNFANKASNHPDAFPRSAT